MRRIKTIVAMLLAAASAVAQNYMYAEPTQVGATQTDYLSVQLKSQKNCKALQFTMELPEGVTLNTARTGGPFEVVSSMYDGSEGNPVKLDYELSNNGRMVKVLLYFTDGNAFTEKSGKVLRMYVQNLAAMPEGNHAIVCKEQVMADSYESATEADAVSSFIHVGNPEQTVTADFSAMQGHMPAEVTNAINQMCQGNMSLTDVRLEGITSLDGELKIDNRNAIVYAGEFLVNYENFEQNNNVVYKVADGEYYADNKITLAGDNTDGRRGNFALRQGVVIECETVEFDRKFNANQWSTICLPLEAAEQFNEEMAQLGFEAYILTGYTPENNKVTYTRVETINANTPYLVRFNGEQQRNITVVGATMDGNLSLNDVTADGMTMKGSYINDIISSDEQTTYFGYDATNGVYKKVGKNVKLGPFRAYLALPKSVAANAPVADVLSVSFINPDDDTTAITGVGAEKSATDKTYNLSGVPVQTPESVTKQVLISNGKKTIR